MRCVGSDADDRFCVPKGTDMVFNGVPELIVGTVKEDEVCGLYVLQCVGTKFGGGFQLSV